MSLTTTAKVKAFLNIANSDFDAILLTFHEAVSKEAEFYCGRNFGMSSYTEYFDGKIMNELVLSQYPISAITSIHDDVDHVYGADTLLDSSTDYVVDLVNGIIKLDNLYFYDGKQNVKVVYTAGYATIPLDLELAVNKLTTCEFIKSQNYINAVEGFESKSDGLRKEAYEILDRYRRMSI
jgi:hypothetical protein